MTRKPMRGATYPYSQSRSAIRQCRASPAVEPDSIGQSMWVPGRDGLVTYPAVLLTQIIEPAGKLDILVKPAHVIVPAFG